MKISSIAFALILFQRPLSELKFGPIFYILYFGFFLLYLFNSRNLKSNYKSLAFFIYFTMLAFSLTIVSSIYSPLTSQNNILVLRHLLYILFFIPVLLSLKYIDRDQLRSILTLSIYVTSVLLILWVFSGGESKSQRSGNPLAIIFEIYTGNRLLLPQYILVTFCYALLNMPYFQKTFVIYTFINLWVSYQMPGGFSFYFIILMMLSILVILNFNVKYLKGLIITTIALGCLFAANYYEEIIGVVNVLEKYSKARALQITETFDFWINCDHCFWLGYGIGGTSELSTGSKGNNLIAHNSVVYFLFEQGIFIFLLFVLICIAVFSSVFMIKDNTSILFIYLFFVVILLSLLKPIFLFSDFYLIVLTTPILVFKRNGTLKWMR